MADMRVMAVVRGGVADWGTALAVFMGVALGGRAGFGRAVLVGAGVSTIPGGVEGGNGGRAVGGSAMKYVWQPYTISIMKTVTRRWATAVIRQL